MPIIRPDPDRVPEPKGHEPVSISFEWKGPDRGRVMARIPGRELRIGQLSWQRTPVGVEISMVGVHQKFQRKGIATAMYKLLFKELGITKDDLVTGYQTEAGRAFRENARIAEGTTFLYEQNFQDDVHQPGSDPYADLDAQSRIPAQGMDVQILESPDDSPMNSSEETMRSQQTYMNASAKRVAKTLVEILAHTGSEVLSSSKGVDLQVKRFDPTRGFWTFSCKGSKGESYTVRVKGVITPKIKNLEKAQVQVSCTCNFFQWQGPEHWAKTNEFLYGKPRGTASRPSEKDPKGENWVCKHVAAALATARRYRFSSSEEFSYEGRVIAMPDPSRVASLYRGMVLGS